MENKHSDEKDLGLQPLDESDKATTQMRFSAPCDWPLSRRDFAKGAGALFGTAVLSGSSTASAEVDQTPVKQVPISMTINGDRKEMEIDPRLSLLDLLRENLKLTGTKKGCDHGQCGACTVLAGGRRINSCLALAVSYDGEELTTVEGLAKGDVLDPVQQAFLDHDGYQCGYCTPGQIISAVALIGEARKGAPSFVTSNLRKTGPVDLTTDEIRERMSGNICRCGAYPGIVAAVHQAYSKIQGEAGPGTDKSSVPVMRGGSDEAL